MSGDTDQSKNCRAINFDDEVDYKPSSHFTLDLSTSAIRYDDFSR